MSKPLLPRVTVALPTCNGARHLREALTGILAQTGCEFDLIVVDDRSEDDTLAIVREICGDRAKMTVNSERLGLAGNWNRCVELSRTEWVAIFHQDDVMHPGHLANQQRLFESQPEARLGLIAGPVTMIDETGRSVPTSVVDPGGLAIDFGGADASGLSSIVVLPGQWNHFLASSNPFRCSAVTILREAHQTLGGFDPSYRYVVDWEFWLRIARKWGLAWCLGPPSVSMRWHASSETHRFKTGVADLEETTRLLDAIDRIDGPDHPWVRKVRPAADRTLARAYLNRAHVALKGGNAELARSCLARSIKLDRSTLARIAVDPRLLVQMTTLKLRPELAIRWFGRPGSGE